MLFIIVIVIYNYSQTCICSGPVYSGHTVYYGHRTTSQNFQLPLIVFSSKLTCIYNGYLAISER